MPPSISHAVLAVLLAVPVPAAAHAVLIDSTPPPQGHVPAGALDISLRYNSRIDSGRCKVTLTAPAGATTRLTTQGRGPDVLDASVTLTSGGYTLHWQVLAVDGHITRGNLPFTVDAAAPAAK